MTTMLEMQAMAPMVLKVQVLTTVPEVEAATAVPEVQALMTVLEVQGTGTDDGAGYTATDGARDTHAPTMLEVPGTCYWHQWQ